MIQPGEVVIVYLQEPREQVWGLLRGLDPAGVTVEGLEIDSFDGWLRCVEEGSGWRSQISVQFFPMQRVQRVLLDRGDEAAASISERLEGRIGRSLAALLDPPQGERV